LPLSYFFHPDARVEHLDHVAFYEQRLPGLGARYLDAFDATMERVCGHPDQYPLAYPPRVRKLRIAGFPYSVLFSERSGRVEVLAVAAHKRRPEYWVNRI
jgi:toxin ParE1/3/4